MVFPGVSKDMLPLAPCFHSGRTANTTCYRTSSTRTSPPLRFLVETRNKKGARVATVSLLTSLYIQPGQREQRLHVYSYKMSLPSQGVRVHGVPPDSEQGLLPHVDEQRMSELFKVTRVFWFQGLGWFVFMHELSKLILKIIYYF